MIDRAQTIHEILQAREFMGSLDFMNSRENREREEAAGQTANADTLGQLARWLHARAEEERRG